MPLNAVNGEYFGGRLGPKSVLIYGSRLDNSREMMSVHQEKPHLKILYNSALSCRILHKNAKTDRIMQMFQIFQIFQITSLHRNSLKDFPNFAEYFGI